MNIQNDTQQDTKTKNKSTQKYKKQKLEIYQKYKKTKKYPKNTK